MDLQFNEIVLDVEAERLEWEKHPDFSCLFADLKNPKGLNLTPMIEPGRVYLSQTLDKMYSGVIGIAHGGYAFTVLDGMMGWFLLSHLGHSGVTSKATVNYFAPMHVGEKYLFEIVLDNSKDLSIKSVPLLGRVKKGDDIILTLEASFFLPTKKQATKILQTELDPIIGKYFRDN